MRHSILLWCVLAFAKSIHGQQLKITMDKYEILYVNKDMITNYEVVVFQFNSTHQAVNVTGTLLQDLGTKLVENVDIYSVEDDGPHLLTTAKDVNVCDVMASEMEGMKDLFKFGNFTQCPIVKGTYVSVNTVLDTSKVPPNIPTGKYMLEIQAYFEKVLISKTKVFLTVLEVSTKAK